ncbi:MAG TPA: acylphosphatase [Dehalococcoidia bacterium]|nr:acylphosphatase [Dehalococcoidia bacterium]
MPELAYLSVTVYGQVQGVFYRAFTSRIAKALSLRGYVRNLPRSNAVEIHAEGSKAKLEELIKQLEVGPPEALVEKIEVNWSEFTGNFANFEVRY